MAVFVDPKSGQRYENVPDADAQRAQSEYGLVSEEQYAREQRSGGAFNEVGTGFEEAGRQVVSAAATLPGSGEVDAMGNPVTTTEGATARGAAPALFSPAALERRQENPAAAAIGGAAPLVAAGAVAPGGLAMSAALDIGAGAAQEATDAAVEDVGITGEHILRNAGLNLLFSGAAHGLTAGARKVVQGSADLLDSAGAALRQARAGKVAASEGAELAEASADPGVRDELLQTIGQKTDKAISATDRALENVQGPRVANNPGAQVEAVDTIADAFEAQSPALVEELRKQAGSGADAASRFDALHAARNAAEPGSDLEQALSGALEREDLWGAGAISHAADLEAARALRPGKAAESRKAFSLIGSDVESLKGLPLDEADLARVEALKADEPFARTGRVSANDAQGGIKIVNDDGDLVIRDGRHRLQAAQDLGRDTVYGTVVDGKTGKTLYQGDLALTEAGLGAGGPTPESIRAYTDAVRKIRAGELGGFADDIDHLTERAQQIRVSPELGGAPGAAPVAKPVDYESAMRMTPAEAWQFKQGGGVEGTRKLAAHSLADSFDAVNNGLRQDVAMSVKRENWVEGAQKWDEGLREKQAAYGESVFNQGADLLRFAEQSKGADAASGFNVGGFATEVRNILQPTLDRIAGLGTSLEDSITRNHELDFLKRAFDNVESKLTASKTVNEASQSALSSRITSFTNDLRNNLQKVELFGQNASLQRELNEGWTKVIDPYKRVRANMSEYLGREHGKVGQNSANLTRFEPLDIERILGGSFDRNLRKDVAASLSGIDGMMKSLQIRGVTHLEGLAKNRASLQRISDLFKLNDVLRVAERTAKEPVGAAVARRVMSAAGGAAIGGHFGGIGGAAIGAIGAHVAAGLGEHVAPTALLRAGADSSFSTLMRKELGALRGEQGQLLGQSAFQLGELSPAMQKQLLVAGGGGDSRVIRLGTAAKEAAETEQKMTARVLINPAAASRFARVAGDAATIYTQFQGEHDSVYQSFQEKRAMLEDFARDPSKMLDVMAEQFGPIGDVSPALHAQMVQQATRVVTFLQGKVPGRRNVSVTYPHGTPAGATEVRQFAVYFMAATQPRSVMSEIRAGRGRQEQVETLRELWPQEYNGLRAETLQAIGTGGSTPITRQRANLLFKFGGAVDPAYGERVMQLLSTARAQKTKASASAPGISRRKLGSANSLAPGGMAALQLGTTLD